jgi:hypothetical protein
MGENVSYMNTSTSLNPTERVEGKAFTHPGYSNLEARVMRYMMLRLCQVLESFHWQANPNRLQPHIQELLEPDGRYHRVLLIQPTGFKARDHFSVVGFFGQRSFDADQGDAAERDKLLFEEMTQHQGLLSYSTLELTNGDYANCILFSDEAAKNQWGRSRVHEKAAREFSPKFYHSVRLYNGVLNAPIMESYKLKLQTVKYFDYSVQPCWSATRVLE